MLNIVREINKPKKKKYIYQPEKAVATKTSIFLSAVMLFTIITPILTHLSENEQAAQGH